MTCKELEKKQPMAQVLVTQRLSGAKNVLGKLIRVSQLDGFPPMAAIEFFDGVEHVKPECVVNPRTVKSGQLPLL